jgi:predicted nucleic acid-binding protein
VLDSSALLAFLYGEPGCNLIGDLLTAAGDRTAVRLHRIHLGEVYYLFYRKGGEPLAEEMLVDVRQLPIILEDRVSPALMREAGRLKASYRLSYADAFAAGLARLRHGTLVSADRREFEPLETAREISVSWVR